MHNRHIANIELPRGGVELGASFMLERILTALAMTVVTAGALRGRRGGQPGCCGALHCGARAGVNRSQQIQRSSTGDRFV